MAKTLYICYFGLREPLVQTQVLPYLRELVKGGHGVSLLTFEPEFRKDWTAEQIEQEHATLMDQGITWHCLPYHKRPSAPATAYDILRGTLFVRRLLAKERFDVLHCRVHVPGMMAALARKLTKARPKMVFDIRGFFPEEFVDAGIWPENGAVFRAAKSIERWLIRESDGFVVLTKKAREILFTGSGETGYDRLGRPVEVIPCCVDFDHRFSGDPYELRLKVRERLGLNGRRVFVHLGALDGLYLTKEIADLLSAARAYDPTTFAMFLTQSDPEKIVPLLKARGFGDGDYLAMRVPAAEVQEYLEASDIGLSVVMATFATRSRSPTKIPEYLACGLPIISNCGVGDVDELLDNNEVGVLLDDLSRESYLAAVKSVQEMSDVSERCRETAHREFDLEEVAGKRYRRLYERLDDNARDER